MSPTASRTASPTASPTGARGRAPLPPRPLPPGRTVMVPGRGELFLRDTGGTGPVVLLVHGWLFASDLNWLRQYAPLARAGYRVLAADLRGHGRGMRSSEPFTFEDCADDLAGMLAALDVDPAVVVGYSMGGPVAQLLAQRSPERVAGLVLCATALDWQDARQRLLWRTMSGLRLLLGAFPQGSWSAMIRRSGGDPATSQWVAAELSRGSARDLAEAGRALGRFDSAGWVGDLPHPAAVVVTGLDRLVPPRKQRALAAALGVQPDVVDADHDACSMPSPVFTDALLAAVARMTRASAAA